MKRFWHLFSENDGNPKNENKELRIDTDNKKGEIKWLRLSKASLIFQREEIRKL